MFTGIIQQIGRINDIIRLPQLIKLSVIVDPSFVLHLQQGASVAIDGVCLTVVKFTSSEIWFDVIEETLEKTSLGTIQPGLLVNLERSAKFGDEIGGHIVSGHVAATVEIQSIDRTENNCVLTLVGAPEWTEYLFPKGYVTLNGASLTLVDVDKENGLFTVHLIPETLQRSTFGSKQVGDLINLEIDSHTQAIVDTVKRFYTSKSTSW